jgi:hypothetical protein
MRYEEAYEPGFEDMHRRVPSVAKLERLTGFRPTMPSERHHRSRGRVFPEEEVGSSLPLQWVRGNRMRLRLETVPRSGTEPGNGFWLRMAAEVPAPTIAVQKAIPRRSTPGAVGILLVVFLLVFRSSIRGFAVTESVTTLTFGRC